MRSILNADMDENTIDAVAYISNISSRFDSLRLTTKRSLHDQRLHSTGEPLFIPLIRHFFALTKVAYVTTM